jgi:acetyl esterase/lipase
MLATRTPRRRARRSVGVVLVGAALALVTACSSSTDAVVPAYAPTDGSLVRQWLTYASSTPTQTLDLYLPKPTGSPAPLVVLIHGGSFQTGDASDMAVLAQKLQSEGFAAAAVNYRLSGEARYPAGAQDVKAAVRWLRAQASNYGYDGQRIGVWGMSAGGWLASMLGVTGDQKTTFDDATLGNADVSSAVRAVVTWYGQSDFATMDAQAAALSSCSGKPTVHGSPSSAESVWLGGDIRTSPLTASTNLASYAAKAATLPAFYLAHGGADCLVPVGQAQELADALKAAGGEQTLVVLPDAAHEDPAFDAGQTQPTIEFLKAQLGL